MSDTETKQKQNLEFIFAFHTADPLLSKDLLIQNKRTVGRPPDLADIAALM